MRTWASHCLIEKVGPGACIASVMNIKPLLPLGFCPGLCAMVTLLSQNPELFM
jgi:hypothetical protein